MRFEPLNGEDPVAFIMSANIARRHMRPSALQLITEQARRVVLNTTPSLRETAKEAGIKHVRLVEAGLVLDYAPDLREKIMAGGMSIQQALRAGRPGASDKQNAEVSQLELSLIA